MSEKFENKKPNGSIENSYIHIGIGDINVSNTVNNAYFIDGNTNAKDSRIKEPKIEWSFADRIQLMLNNCVEAFATYKKIEELDNQYVTLTDDIQVNGGSLNRLRAQSETLDRLSIISQELFGVSFDEINEATLRNIYLHIKLVIWTPQISEENFTSQIYIAFPNKNSGELDRLSFQDVASKVQEIEEPAYSFASNYSMDFYPSRSLKSEILPLYFTEGSNPLPIFAINRNSQIGTVNSESSSQTIFVFLGDEFLGCIPQKLHFGYPADQTSDLMPQIYSIESKFKIIEFIQSKFSKVELEELCFSMNANREDFRTDSIKTFALDLVRFTQHRNRYQELIIKLFERRETASEWTAWCKIIGIE